MTSTPIKSALKKKDHQNPEALEALDALGNSLPELEKCLRALMAEVEQDKDKFRHDEKSSRRMRDLQRLVVGIGRHLARSGDQFSESLLPALRYFVDSFVEHLDSPAAVEEAMGAIPKDAFEALLTEDQELIAFWPLLPSCVTDATLLRATSLVLGWEDGRLSSSLLPGIATRAFFAAGGRAVGPLATAILSADEQPYRGVLVDALVHLPPGGTDALVHALGDSNKAIRSSARAGLLSRGVEALEAVGRKLASTSEEAAVALLSDVHAELKANVGDGPGSNFATLRTMHASRAQEIRKEFVDPGLDHQAKAEARIAQFAESEPEATMFALLQCAALDLPALFDAIYVFAMNLEALEKQAAAGTIAAELVATYKEDAVRREVVAAQFKLLTDGLGEALRAPLIHVLRTRHIAYSEVFYGWIAKAPAADAIELFAEGLLAGKKIRDICSRALIAIGQEGAISAAPYLQSRKKAVRLAAASIQAQVPTQSLTEALKDARAKERSSDVRAHLDTALRELIVSQS
ncbi:MAG: hypothetical protein GY811_28160 [Myxococcales bacterium]|nr:hypothetical protein [Myxococcales bacterium]